MPPSLYGYPYSTDPSPLVRKVGVEPTRLSALAPEASVSAISPLTQHCVCLYLRTLRIKNSLSSWRTCAGERL